MKQPQAYPVSAAPNQANAYPVAPQQVPGQPMPGQQQVQGQQVQGGGQIPPQLMPSPVAAPGQVAPAPYPGLPGGAPQQPHAMPAPTAPQMPPQQGMPHGGQAMPVQQGAPAGMPPATPQMMHVPEVETRKEGGEKALPRIAIHAFCERPDSAGALQATTQDWRMARASLKIYMGGIAAAIEYYQNESTPSLIIFESSLRAPDLFEQLDKLASVCDSGTKVVMMGATNDIRLYRELMDKGLSDYIVPPFHPLPLIRSISELFSDPEKPFVGRVVAFFGAKGGVGSSTLAHNVAWGLANGMGQETALVDLDSSWGTTGLDFHFDNVQGLEEALADHERLDETLLDRIMVRHSEKLSILPAAASLGTPAPSSVESYEALVSGVRSLSPLTILDMPHVWTEWSCDMIKRADEIVITATPDLANLRNAKNLVDYLKAARPNDPAPLLIVNKTGVPKTAEIPVKDFAAAIGIQPAVVLPYEPIVYTEASNEGKMLSEISAAAQTVDGIMYLAHRLRTGNFPNPVSKKKGKFKKIAKKNKGGGSVQGNAKSSLFSKMKKRK
jgi:pilus assembly protein CpaE